MTMKLAMLLVMAKMTEADYNDETRFLARGVLPVHAMVGAVCSCMCMCLPFLTV